MPPLIEFRPGPLEPAPLLWGESWGGRTLSQQTQTGESEAWLSWDALWTPDDAACQTGPEQSVACQTAPLDGLDDTWL